MNTLWNRIEGAIARVWRSRRGNVAVITALIAPALLGGFGVGFETAHWYQVQKSLQNAADSAAVAAATNDSSSYATEASATAAQYGYTSGSNNVTVSSSNTAACPSGGNTCFSVTITENVPLYLTQLLGFQGNTTIAGAYSQSLTATAVAQPGAGSSTTSFCLLALASSGATGITTNGAPKANLDGCNIMSNTDATCNGHDLGATDGDAHGTSSGCGTVQNSGLPVMADPYASLASNIPSNSCSSYAQEPSKKKDPALPASNQLSGSYTWNGTQTFCGDVQLTGNVNITTGAGGAVLLIENGQLDTNGYTLETTASSGLTVVFSGTDSSSYTYAPTGGGTLDIAAPTSGAWSGVAIYQDPSLNQNGEAPGVDISAAGNSPTWDITGLVYLPHSSVTFSGAVNKSSNGYSCFDLVVDNITINGTGSILDEGQCSQAGVTLPSYTAPGGRGSLVA